jgi:hypothetical protein
MGTMTKWRITPADEIAQTAPHPEDGERREFRVWFCVATDEHGHRFRSALTFAEPDQLLWAVEKLQEVVDKGLEDIETSEVWIPWWPVFGSDAHDESDLMEWERRIEDDSKW